MRQTAGPVGEADAPFPARYMLHPLRPAARGIIRSRYRVRVHGAEHVPSDGPVILASNHVGVMDGPALAIFAPRPVHALTKAEMYQNAFWGRFLRGSGQIPLWRHRPDPFAVRQSLRVLADDAVVGIFPEGARGPGDLSRFHRGAAYLAMVSGAPVVPVIMLGTRLPGQRSSSIPPRGAEVDISFFPPIRLARSDWPRTASTVRNESLRLRDRMIECLEEAMAATGRSLPGALPAGDEIEPGPGVVESARD